MELIKIYPFNGDKTYLLSEASRLSDENCTLGDHILKQKDNLISSRSNSKDIPFVVAASLGNGNLYIDRIATRFIFILEANDGELILGTPDVKKADVNKRLTFSSFKVKNGDYFTIPKGTVFSVGERISYIEVYPKTNNLNLIDTNEALNEFSLPEFAPLLKKPAIKNENEGFSVKIMSTCESYTVAQITVVGKYSNSIGSGSFKFFFCLDGVGEIEYNGKTRKISASDCIFAPSGFGDFTISGGMEILVFSK